MNNKITINDVITLVDALKPNNRTTEEKIMWLNDLDRTVKEEIFDTHEGTEDYPFECYTEDTPSDTILLIPARFGRTIYRYYLELQIDMINKELNKYNTAAALYESNYNEFELYWHSTHMPLQNNSIHF